MRNKAVLIFMVTLLPCAAQTTQQDIHPTQLQVLLNLPLDQAEHKRDAYKRPLRAAYARQSALAGKDCQMEQGQQPLNRCIGQADEVARNDYATFYNNLQMLCHGQDELIALQMSEVSWTSYRENSMKAARIIWPDGTASSGVIGRVYLSLVRDRMNELSFIYDSNISR